jgi:oligopeptide/dipeptide ABC transporter ATP-binding protein
VSVLELEHLSVRFETPRGAVQAVRDVSLRLEPGATLGLVGESGSGKSVTAQTILGLLPPGARVESGSARFEGRELLGLPERELRALRGRRIAMVFQDPLSALDPLATVGRQLGEVLEAHLSLRRREVRRRCAAALAEVGLPDPEQRLGRYPHELSGGQRQRVLIAMALLHEPRVLLADEPTTALDVTLQAQVLDLFEALQQRHGTAVLLITHDLGVVARACQRVLVMYAGRVVEEAGVEALFAAPLHPYTRALLDSLPRLDAHDGGQLRPIPGAPPDPLEPQVACAFAPRCALARERCRTDLPALEPLRQGREGRGLAIRGERLSACFEKQRLAPAASAGEGPG